MSAREEAAVEVASFLWSPAAGFVIYVDPQLFLRIFSSNSARQITAPKNETTSFAAAGHFFIQRAGAEQQL
jgi:hypothetical protein